MSRKSKTTKKPDVSRQQVRAAIHDMVDFIKERVRLNIVESSRSGTVSLDEETLRRVLSVADQSISQGHQQSYTQLERLLEKM
tara:strand:- start:1103 stop:1351 length:249 start_codon:yes stop_codon:yes gene_type:complete